MDQFQSEHDKLKNAEEYKAAGNKAYVAKNYRLAIGKYHRALMYLRGVTHGGKPSFADLMSPNPDKKIPESILKRMDVLTSECYNNLAACLLAAENPKHEKVVEYCERVLELEPSNVKAAFRMGTALLHLGNYEKAKEMLTSNEAFAGEKQIQNLLVKIEAHLKKCERQLEEAYKKMFQVHPKTPASKGDEKDNTAAEATNITSDVAKVENKTVLQKNMDSEGIENGEHTEGNQGGKIILVSSINPEGEDGASPSESLS